MSCPEAGRYQPVSWHASCLIISAFKSLSALSAAQFKSTKTP